MKIKTINGLVVAALGLAAIALPAASLAAITLKNGGLGQVAGDTQNFGVAICNSGSKAVTQSVPVLVTANGETVSVSSAASIAAGTCAYSYLGYGQLGLQAGKTYSVSVTVNNADQAVYSVTVPTPAPTAAATQPNANTANVNASAGNLWTSITNFFSQLLGRK